MLVPFDLARSETEGGGVFRGGWQTCPSNQPILTAETTPFPSGMVCRQGRTLRQALPRAGGRFGLARSAWNLHPIRRLPVSARRGVAPVRHDLAGGIVPARPFSGAGGAAVGGGQMDLALGWPV